MTARNPARRVSFEPAAIVGCAASHGAKFLHVLTFWSGGGGCGARGRGGISIFESLPVFIRILRLFITSCNNRFSMVFFFENFNSHFQKRFILCRNCVIIFCFLSFCFLSFCFPSFMFSYVFFFLADALLKVLKKRGGSRFSNHHCAAMTRAATGRRAPFFCR